MPPAYANCLNVARLTLERRTPRETHIRVQTLPAWPSTGGNIRGSMISKQIFELAVNLHFEAVHSQEYFEQMMRGANQNITLIIQSLDVDEAIQQQLFWFGEVSETIARASSEVQRQTTLLPNSNSGVRDLRPAVAVYRAVIPVARFLLQCARSLIGCLLGALHGHTSEQFCNLFVRQDIFILFPWRQR